MAKGRIERRGDSWTFVAMKFEPQSPMKMIMSVRKSTRAYLEKRGLPWPKVNFDAAEELWNVVRNKRV